MSYFKLIKFIVSDSSHLMLISTASTMYTRIDPEQLVFEDVVQCRRVLRVRNVSDENIIYKVRTTAPDLYIVRPNVNTILQGQELELEFVYLGQETSHSGRDKFMIITAPVGDTSYDKQVLETDWDKIVSGELKHRAVSKKIPVLMTSEEGARGAREYIPTRKYVIMLCVMLVIVAYILKKLF